LEKLARSTVGSMLDAVFAFLFKYPLRVYQRGDLILAPGWPPAVIAVTALAALVLVAAMYRRVRTSGRRDRVVPAVLAVGASRRRCDARIRRILDCCALWTTPLAPQGV
jgi:hypothetical protein